MKKDTHPEFKETTIECACGKVFKTKSTKTGLEIEICSNCHPFYTGKEKIVDKMGRVEKFNKKREKAEKAKGEKAKKEQKKAQKEEQEKKEEAKKEDKEKKAKKTDTKKKNKKEKK